jgi:hypothetical protein
VDAPFIYDSEGTKRQGVMRQLGQDWELVLGERELVKIDTEHMVRLLFGDFEIKIESPFTVTSQGRSHHCFENDSLEPLLNIYPDSLVDTSLDAAGTLNLTFKSGVQLQVPPDPNYEAWQVVGPGKNLIVCVPGGREVAVWADQ